MQRTPAARSIAGWSWWRREDDARTSARSATLRRKRREGSRLARAEMTGKLTLCSRCVMCASLNRTDLHALDEIFRTHAETRCTSTCIRAVQASSRCIARAEKMNKLPLLSKHLLRQHAGTRKDDPCISDALAATSERPRFTLPRHDASYRILL